MTGARWQRSEQAYRRSLERIPGGVNSPVRAMGQIDRDPIFAKAGAGCELTDLDGNRYVDWICSWGALPLGHAPARVVAAVSEAAAAGTSFGVATEAEVELAEEVAARVPSVEMMRMTSSGTEAAMSAVRLARAATGKERLVKFAGAYHGHADGLLAEAGSGVAEGSGARPGVPGSPGVPESQAADTLIAAWNDLEAVETALSAGGVAAVIAEPVPANMGLIPPQPGFLAGLRQACDRAGALLIFDEVITGFRVARGGAQELFGVMPDLTVMGKVLGGGLPAAAFGGPGELMSHLAPAGDVYQAGTLSGNPLAVAAGLATLRELDDDAYRRLAQVTEQLASGLAAPAADAGCSLRSLPGLLTLFFRSPPPEDFAQAADSDEERHADFCRRLLAEGVYPPPSRFEAWFPSLAHDRAAVDQTVSVASAALAEVGA